MDLKIGCTGWSYEGWSGTFYPKFLKSIEWLKYYSSVFDITSRDFQTILKRSPGIDNFFLDAFNVAVLQSPNVISGGGQATNTGAWALANLGSNTAQELYGVFCNIGPGAPPNAGILNSLSNTVYSGGPGQNQFVMDSQNQASLDASKPSSSRS